MKKTLQEYLEQHAGNACTIDFELTVTRFGEGQATEFYIHPLDKDGATWDFMVSGNQLIFQRSAQTDDELAEMFGIDGEAKQ